MPTYEYACTECENQVEVYQSFTDPPLEICEACSGRLRRVYHPVAVVFKGSGFYSTDARANRGGGKKKEAGKDHDKSETPAGSSDGKASKDSGGGAAPAASSKKAKKPETV